MGGPPQGALERIALAMTSTLDVDEVLARITSGLLEDLGAARARVWLVDTGDACATCAQAPGCADRERCLHLRASAGLSTRLDGAHRRVPLGALKIGQIALQGTPVQTNDLEGDPRITDKSWVRGHGLAAFAGYPLAFRGELLGVLAVFSRRPLAGDELGRLALFAAQASVAIQNARLYTEVARLRQRLADENAYLREELGRDRGAAAILGKSPALRAALDKLEQVAPTTATVLLLGETGTGKELFAVALHAASRRHRGPLVKVSCAAISAALLESELFGHEKGAFTTALSRHVGRFELAHGGTLFLDEVGELPLESQAKLLRVLQEHEIERVGGTRRIPVDVRIVAATNRDLAAEAKAGRFRADLYYRLAVFPIELPPLRARREDVPALALAFVERCARTLGKPSLSISDEALAALAAYSFPGNVRELHNVVERAAILARGDLIDTADLPDLAPAPGPDHEGAAGGAPAAAKGTLEDVERAHVRETLEACGWRIEGAQGAAVRLGLSPSTLRSRMARLSIRRPRS
jgi:transcriptional regulator with GAF, ATPase, and Fis domain